MHVHVHPSALTETCSPFKTDAGRWGHGTGACSYLDAVNAEVRAPWHRFSSDRLAPSSSPSYCFTTGKRRASKARPKPELEPRTSVNGAAVEWSGVYHYAIKATMSPEKGNKRKEGHERARDGRIPNFTLRGADTANGSFSLAPSSVCAVFPAMIPHSHLTSASVAVICLYGGSQAREIAPLEETDLPFAAAAGACLSASPSSLPLLQSETLGGCGAWI